MALRFGGDLSGGGGCLQRAKIKTPRSLRDAAVEQDQTEQENEAAEREIDRNFPRGRLAISAAPNSDKQESRNQRQLVEGVKEEQIDRCESAKGAARDQKKTGVKSVFMLRDFAGEPDRAKRHDGRQQQHDEAEAIRA